MASAIELSLRRALEKGDASDPYFRTSVYEAAERAMDRLADEKSLNSATELQQRQQLIAAIEAIEHDYPELAPELGHEPEMVEPGGDPAEPFDETIQQGAGHDARDAEIAADAGAPTEPVYGTTPAERLRAMFAREGAEPRPAPAEPDWTPGADRERGSLLSSRKVRLGLAAVLALLVGLLLAYVLTPAGESAPDASVTTGSIEGDTGGPWINVFSGNNIELVTAPPAAASPRSTRPAAKSPSASRPAPGRVARRSSVCPPAS